MKVCLSLIMLCCLLMATGESLSDQYLEEWKKFYPTRALQSGIRTSIFHYEDRSQQAIDQWVTYNQEVLNKITEKGSEIIIHPIDGRLLRVQAQSEIDRWTKLRLHENDLNLYLQLLKNTFSSVFEADYLLSSEKGQLICDRLSNILQLANAAQINLKEVTRSDLDESKEVLDGVLSSLLGLSEEVRVQGIYMRCEGFEVRLGAAQTAIKALSNHVSETLSKSVSERSEILGRTEYARQLALYTDSDLTPDDVAGMALKEIKVVRLLMDEVASRYLRETYNQASLPESFEERIKKALSDMGKDVPLNGKDYEQFWLELSDKAMAFVAEKGLGTLPDRQTLSIQSAPESAGPAARIGWVGSALPFDPNPWTTLYLPSIPETLPEKEQKDFWSSFNKPFNRIIVIHELFPGHYMQLKISRETPHPVRLLFPYGIYIEGWATFCERVALDEGWDAGNDMTMLAHLRKRIENANRAYMSVMVHTQGWTKEQVMKFSTETALVAPQFAKSLWFRLMRSPMQLTSYFLGGAQFSTLLQFEKERLDDHFDLTLFMDTIMKSGPIPIDEFYGIFSETIPR